jgi:hypothetical protein
MRALLLNLLGVVLCAVMVCHAAPPAGNGIKVASKGVTDITTAFGKTQVSVKITTHEVDVGMPSDPRPEKILSNCTYSQFPCSPVDHLDISINGNPLFVARSVYADLADVGVVSLRQQKKGLFVLTMAGGDASESYTVEITFDINLVRQRTFMSNEVKQVTQRTTYFEPPAMDK